MKKAKDYAEYIISHNSNKKDFIEAMAKVLRKIVGEIAELAESRNIKRKSALRAIILEQDRKWKAVCRRIEVVGMDNVFMDYLEKELPELLEEANI